MDGEICPCSCGTNKPVEPTVKGYKWIMVPEDFDITWGDNLNVTEPPKVENEEVSHGFMDSLLYVMIPSLLSFFALFWAFYALHSYTVDTKVVSQLYQRMKESRNSIRQKFTNSVELARRSITKSHENFDSPKQGHLDSSTVSRDEYAI